MARSAALLILPTGASSDEEKDPLQVTSSLLTQSLQDLALAEHIDRALRGAGHGLARGISVTVGSGLVTLKGRVPSYYLKQVVQETALAVSGTHRIRNDLEVGRPG